MQKAAIASHSTDTTDAGWDGPANKARLPSARGPLRAAFAWVDAAGDPDVKESYKFIHHMVSDGGEVGAANVRACTSAIGVLNGGRGGTVIPDSDKPGVWAHLARHLRDAGVEAIPDLKGFVIERAYAVLQVKQVDESQRVLEGMATTPATDRAGDVIEPLGVTYTNPVPLLLYHDSTQPVGTVTLGKATEAGVPFRAQLARISEPGRLRDRVDEAWQSVKAGLIRGVSIGFRVLNDAIERVKETGGYRYLETEVLELSLVVIPANQQATISTIRSCDQIRPAAPGRADPVFSVNHRSGVADLPRGRETVTPSERLTKALADQRAKTERLEAFRKAAEDVTPTEAERAERAQLTSEIETLAVEIRELRALEAAIGQEAAPLTKTVAPARVAAVEVKQTLPPGIEFARLMICKMIATLSNGAVSALEIARNRYPDNPRIQTELKAAVGGATTTTSGWASELVYPTQLASEFVEYLRPLTIIGKFGTGNIPSLRTVPFNVRIVGNSAGAVAGWVGQGKLKPLTKLNTGVVATMTPAKVACIAVFGDEVGRFSSPSIDALVRDELAEAIIERLDTDFVDPNKAVAANVSPASITNGLVALTPSGTDAAAVRADLAQLLQTFIDANNPPSSGVLITSNTVALSLSLMTNALGQPEFPSVTMLGGTLRGFPLIASQYCAIGSPASNLLILVNAKDIFLADDGGITVDVSREASLEMSDDPENESGTVVSMFQSNQLALRAERTINWAKRRASAAAYLDGVAYASGSPS